MTTNPSAPLTFTNSAYVRSHGRNPRGDGCWAFQMATAPTAYDDQLFGLVRFVGGTLTEAKAVLKRDGAAGLWAVLP